MADEESQWKDVWNLYDTERSGKVSKEAFLDCVRICTRRYPMSVLAEKTKSLGTTVSYEAFFDFMCEPYSGPTPEDLDHALKAFDGKESGELTIAQITTLLTTMGDKLDLGAIKPVLDAMPQNAGKVRIAELVKFLTPPVPTAKPDIDELLRELIREEAAKMNFSEGEPEISQEVNDEFERRKRDAADGADGSRAAAAKAPGLLGDEMESVGDSSDDHDE